MKCLALSNIVLLFSISQKYRCNAFVRSIKIKTEADIEQSLGVKVECDDIDTHNKRENDGAPKQEPNIMLQEEKEKSLISSIASLKSENHRLCFALNEKVDELNATKIEHEKIVRELKDTIQNLDSDRQ